MRHPLWFARRTSGLGAPDSPIAFRKAKAWIAEKHLLPCARAAETSGSDQTSIVRWMGTVTVAATYGAGGSVIAPAVARRLELPFVDRAIPVALAEEIHEPLDAALADDADHTPRVARLLDRVLATSGLLLTFEGGSEIRLRNEMLAASWCAIGVLTTRGIGEDILKAVDKPQRVLGHLPREQRVSHRAEVLQRLVLVTGQCAAIVVATGFPPRGGCSWPGSS